MMRMPVLLCALMSLLALLACESNETTLPGDTDGESVASDGDSDTLEEETPSIQGDDDSPHPGDMDQIPNGDKDELPDGDMEIEPDRDPDTPVDGDLETPPDGDDDFPSEADVDLFLDGDIDADPDIVDVVLEPIAIADLYVVENPANPLSFFISWRTEIKATTRLHLVCGDDIDQTFTSDELTKAHEVFVMGLYEAASCDVTVHATAQDRSGQAATRIENVGPLPEFLPDLTVTEYHAEQVQPGWTFFSLTRISAEAPDYVVGIDFQGRYRWMYVTGRMRTNGGHEIALHPSKQGLIVAGSEPQVYVSWDGREIWNLQKDGNHDTVLSPWNPDHLLYLGRSSYNCNTSEHSVHEYNLTTGENIWNWYVCEHIIPRVEYNGWSHFNTITPVPNERAMLISSRDQDIVFKLNRDTDAIEWTLGRGGDFIMNSEAFFLRQHSPKILSNGHILLFDNGLGASEAARTQDLAWVRPYSRALEFELHFDTDGQPFSAEVVWEYTDTSLFALNRSEADRLDNGNTLLIYVSLQPDFDQIIREITFDKSIVWNVHIPEDYSSYRSERIDPTYGFVTEPE